MYWLSSNDQALVRRRAVRDDRGISVGQIGVGRDASQQFAQLGAQRPFQQVKGDGGGHGHRQGLHRYQILRGEPVRDLLAVAAAREVFEPASREHAGTWRQADSEVAAQVAYDPVTVQNGVQALPDRGRFPGEGIRLHDKVSHLKYLCPHLCQSWPVESAGPPIPR
ncbi:hypothetical protein DER30_6898 [Streptomyces sp. HB202]|nr:hypothetical protein DER30_6898 [Streptomyces sp. HB202]